MIRENLRDDCVTISILFPLLCDDEWVRMGGDLHKLVTVFVPNDVVRDFVIDIY